MRDSIAGLRHKIASADELGSVVRSMKTIASSSIGQYETAVRSLDDYYRAVQLGLAACLRQQSPLRVTTVRRKRRTPVVGVIVFGSDQGLVGQFNEMMVEFVIETLAKIPGQKVVWAVGERIQSQLSVTPMTLNGGFPLPNSINAITELVGSILTDVEANREQGNIDSVYLFHHRPEADSIYTPVSQQQLPLNEAWEHHLATIHWPTNNLPEVMPDRDGMLRALVREYLFVSLFRACAESLASENAARLAAMQRAEKNIDELREELNQTFHRLRQSGIDEELFDVLAGFENIESEVGKKRPISRPGHPGSAD